MKHPVGLFPQVFFHDGWHQPPVINPLRFRIHDLPLFLKIKMPLIHDNDSFKKRIFDDPPDAGFCELISIPVPDTILIQYSADRPGTASLRCQPENPLYHFCLLRLNGHRLIRIFPVSICIIIEQRCGPVFLPVPMRVIDLTAQISGILFRQDCLDTGDQIIIGFIKIPVHINEKELVITDKLIYKQIPVFGRTIQTVQRFDNDNIKFTRLPHIAKQTHILRAPMFRCPALHFNIPVHKNPAIFFYYIFCLFHLHGQCVFLHLLLGADPAVNDGTFLLFCHMVKSSSIQCFRNSVCFFSVKMCSAVRRLHLDIFRKCLLLIYYSLFYVSFQPLRITLFHYDMSSHCHQDYLSPADSLLRFQHLFLNGSDRCLLRWLYFWFCLSINACSCSFILE